MVIIYGKIHESFISIKKEGRNRGWDAQGKSKLWNYVQDHCAQGVLKLLM